MGGCRVSVVIQPLDRQTPREHILPAPRDLGCWGPHADSPSHADPAIGAVFTSAIPISLYVSELELARIDSDTRSRAEDVRERNAQYAWKRAPGLMAHKWAHEALAAR
jgi:hypothetical protein